MPSAAAAAAATTTAMPAGEPLFDFQVSRIQQHAAAASRPQKAEEISPPMRSPENEEGAAPKRRVMVPMSKAEAEEGQDKITKQVRQTQPMLCEIITSICVL